MTAMTKREVIRTLLSQQIPDRVGLNEHFWPHILDNGWREQGVTDENWATRYDLDLRSQNWCKVPGPRPDLETVIEENDSWKTTRDGWGAQFKFFKKKAGTPEHIAFAVTPANWQSEWRERTLAIDMRTTVDVAKARQARATALAQPQFLTYAGLAIFEELRRILGDVVMLESLASEPEFIEDFCTVITTKHLEYWDYLFREVGLPDGLHIYEDVGYTRGPFCSPRMHCRLVQPHHHRLFGFFKEHKLPLIVHTCGDFRPHLKALHETGVDCIQALEAKTGMDVVELAKEWKGKMCFMGNLDIRAFESGDREKIKAECLGKLNGMKALRAPYIFMSDHSIPPSVKVADYEYALDLYRTNCRY